jgi:integrase
VSDSLIARQPESLSVKSRPIKPLPKVASLALLIEQIKAATWRPRSSGLRYNHERKETLFVHYNGIPMSRELITQRASRVRKYLGNAKAAGTRRVYESHWRDFSMFCTEQGAALLPANPLVVVDYITYLADLGAKYSTIQVKVAAISHYHRAANLPSPIKSIEVQETMKGIRRTIGASQKGKSPISLDILKKLLAVLPDNLRGIRDKAILLVGFAGAFRRSELTGIKYSDIKIKPGYAEIFLGKTKTDQEGQGMIKHIPELQNKAICPVTALRTWLQAAGISDGVVFRPIGKSGNVINRFMNSQEVARLVKKYAAAAEIDPTLLSGHSLRAGFVTEAASRDQPLWKIKQQTGHRSDQVLQRYIRDQGRGAHDATKSAFGE